MMKLFNSRFEIQLRVLLILLESQDRLFSTDMLAALDFISVFGADFGISDKNLNGNSLFRFSELASRRELVQKATKEMVLKGLIDVDCGKGGYKYKISYNGIIYANKMESDYAIAYKKCVKKVFEFITNKSEQEVLQIIRERSVSSLRGGN